MPIGGSSKLIFGAQWLNRHGVHIYHKYVFILTDGQDLDLISRDVGAGFGHGSTLPIRPMKTRERKGGRWVGRSCILFSWVDYR